MKGKEHPLVSLYFRMRDIFLNLGLDEVINPIIIDEEDVFLQYGKEAPLILDRIYYLAGLDRAEIGLSKEREKKIAEIAPDFAKLDVLKTLLRDYKEQKIEADNLLEIMTERLGITKAQTIRIIDEVFSELSGLIPIPGKKTLRSHMTSAWYLTLTELQKTQDMPLRLFSFGPRFRREQRQTPSHLFESTASSIVIMEKGFSLKNGEELTGSILKEIGFLKWKCVQKPVTSNYYEEGTDTEIFVVHNGREVEVANYGFYSKESLKNYGIHHKVFNLGFGVERIAGLLLGEDDLRRCVWPQFSEFKLSDEEIAGSIRPEKEPSSDEGKNVAEELLEKAKNEAKRLGPVEILAYSGNLSGRDIKIWVYNWDEGKPLLSYAAFNKIWVKDGQIYGLPENPDKIPQNLSDVYDKGIKKETTFLKMLITGFVAELEQEIASQGKEIDRRWKIARRPQEINISIPDYVYRYITSHNKKIAVGGPLFFGLKAQIR
ncbi:MAG: O-phosphoserine--tRNA ligase [bacterium]